MMKSLNRKSFSDFLLKEFIKETVLLREDGEGGESGAMPSGIGYTGVGGAMTPQQSGMGGIYLGSGTLGQIFINPFKRVAKTLIGKSKEVLASIKMFVRVSFEAVVSSLVPFLEAEYDQIFKDEKNEIDAIRKDYKDVYDATNKALSGDAAVFAFFAAPGPMAAIMATRAAPDAAVGALKVADSFSGGALGWLWGKAKKKNPFDFSDKSLHDSWVRRNSLLLEEKDLIKSIRKNPQALEKISKSIENSPKFKEAQNRVIKINQETMKKSLEHAVALGKAKTIEDLQTLTGKKIDFMNMSMKQLQQKRESLESRGFLLFEAEENAEKSNQEKEKKPDSQKMSEVVKSLNPAEKSGMEKQMLLSLRESLAKAYMLPIQKRIDAAKKAGAQDDNPFVLDCQKTLDAIKKAMGK